MRPDRVEVSWEAQKSKWLVRIISGDEVIRRTVDARKDAHKQALRAAAHSRSSRAKKRWTAGTVQLTSASRNAGP